MRKNAEANRERILAAATAVFGAHGALGSTEEVAQRAGVGIATVFRHFPTKDKLIEAALLRHFEDLNRRAAQLSTVSDSSRAFYELVCAMIDTGATKLVLASLVGERGEFPPAVRSAADDLRRTISSILDRAKGAGAVDGKVTVDELYFLIRGLAHAAAAMPPTPSTMRRAIDILSRGLASPR